MIDTRATRYGMRLGIICLALVSAATAASAQRPVRQDMSPEGVAVFERFFSTPDAQSMKCLEDRKNAEARLVELGEKEPFDWPAAKAMLARQADMDVKCSNYAKGRFTELMEQLPPADRVLYFRSLHRTIVPPQIKLVEPGNKSGK